MVAIKDMKMPENCYDCYRNMYCIVGIDGGWRPDKRVEGCPLVEIGTCKNCRWLTADEDGNYYCIQTGCFDSFDFYCADFEKRGNEKDGRN